MGSPAAAAAQVFPAGSHQSIFSLAVSGSKLVGGSGGGVAADPRELVVWDLHAGDDAEADPDANATAGAGAPPGPASPGPADGGAAERRVPQPAGRDVMALLGGGGGELWGAVGGEVVLWGAAAAAAAAGGGGEGDAKRRCQA
jgi:hypothetical protein